MKNLLIALAAFVTATVSALSLSPIIVVTGASNANNISIEVKNGSQSLYTESFEELELTSSGLLVFTVGKNNENWTEISDEVVTTNHTVDILQNGVIIAQFRLDYLIDISARYGLGGNGDITSQEEVTFEGDVTFEGNHIVNGTSSLSSQVFTNLTELGGLTANIWIYESSNDISFDRFNLNSDLADNTVYYITNDFNEAGNILTFETDSGDRNVSEGETLILLKAAGKFYVLNAPD